MPKIRMKTMSAGPDGVMQQGVIYLVSAEEAESLVNGNYAEYVDRPLDEENVDDESDLTDEELAAQLRHVGGSTFELPSGEKVKGKEAAIEALRAKLENETTEE